MALRIICRGRRNRHNGCGNGSDQILGSNGNDNIFGGHGANEIIGGEGHDTIFGGGWGRHSNRGFG
jgi:Ca2+-binding RTX toxin-like protein